MRTGSIQLERGVTPRLSRRLLALATDERLVEEVKRGNEAALEVAYDRHGARLLSFCRHMLGSLQEAEEAVQHTFAAAWSDLQRNPRQVHLKAWLYAIARNRCLSMLRARRPEPVELDDSIATAGFTDEVATRADLRELLADVGDLPEEQRAALVLAELGGLSHADIAEVIERKEADVKALVFRARSALIDWRQARETPCEEVREQLADLRGGSLRRRWLSRHLQTCADCREFRGRIKAQRRMLALVIPVVPQLGFKESVLAAAGLGGGAAGGQAAVAGLGAAAAAGSATIAKVAVVGALAGGALMLGESAIDREADAPAGTSTPSSQGQPATKSSSSRPLSPADRAASERSRPTERGLPGGRGPKAQRGNPSPGRTGPASALAPPKTPVRAKGSPPAIGRARRGLVAPQPGLGVGKGQGRTRRPTAPPRGNPSPPRTTPPPRSDAPKPDVLKEPAKLHERPKGTLR